MAWKWFAILLVVVANPFALFGDDAPPGVEESPLVIDQGDLNGLKLPGAGGGLLGGETVGTDHVSFAAEYRYDKGREKAKISVTAEIQEGWHVYSITQGKQEGLGPNATRFIVKSSDLDDPDALGDGKRTPEFFTADQDAHKHIDQKAWPGLQLEEHERKVTWTAYLDLAPGTDPEAASFKITPRGQVCQTDGSCVNFPRQEIELEFGGYVEPPKTPGKFAATNVTLEGRLEPATIAPGEKVKLVVTARPDPGWHLYALENKDPKHTDGRGKPTLITLTKLDGLTFGGITASVEPKVKAGDGVVGPQQYYEGEVSWTVELTAPRNLPEGVKTIVGYIGVQTCDANSCARPEGVKFEVTLPTAGGLAAPTRGGGEGLLRFEESKYSDVAAAAESSAYAAPEPVSLGKLLVILGLGVVGGLILNLMPCVLPVIGLKVLSFAEQGGQSRGRVLALNISYSAGLIAVFLALATVAVFLNLSWGQQFTYTWFKVAMIGLVFAMAISFLGIWEIPIPGFASTNKTESLQQHEGLSGAFFKGIFTTILATPCSGPFLGSVFGFTLGQSWYITYLIFFSVGFGMALPYLIIGLQPALVRWLPKPGEWMDTFKQFMGFVLLGTVVYLFSTIKKDYYLPTLTMVVGLWFGCWIIGRVPSWAELPQKLRGWAVGSISAGLITAAAFYMLAPWPHLYHWTPYTDESLAKAQAEGKTVLVDFTADWCQTCQFNFFWTINTNRVKSVIERNKVEPLLADWTDESPEIEEKINELNSNSIPLLAIYPANRPGEVIVLRDLVTQQQLIEALEQAGPSDPKHTAEISDLGLQMPD